MPALTRRGFFPLLLAAPAAIHSFADDSADWISLFDGRTLQGWKPTGHSEAFSVANGQIAVGGSRAFLFYSGPAHGADFRNFAFSAEALMRPGARSAICFHAAPAENAPFAGFQVLLATDYHGANGYIQRFKSGSLDGVRYVYKQLVNDNGWFRINILVRQKQVQVRLNDALVVDYVEPAQPFHASREFRCLVGHGTFALRALDSQSASYFRNIRVRPLPDDIAQTSDEQPEVDEVYREIIRLGAENYPVVDYHVHLNGGLTIAQTLANSRRTGIGYGVACNCGINHPVHDDATVRDYLESMKGQPCFAALQGEGREWPTLVSPETIARCDYTFTDAMTFSDDNGKRMRIWMPEEIGVVTDSQAFMDMLVKRIEGIMREPIDIYANATYLPDQIAGGYDVLWTPERMQRVIDAALKHDVAIEINNRRDIPSPAFIKKAKAAGCKFSFGANNAQAELGRLEYPIRMVRECGLAWQDMFVPKSKPAQVTT
jgi:hypothetical protein